MKNSILTRLLALTVLLFGFVTSSVSAAVVSGSYTGNGVDGRAINLGFQPDVVFIQQADTAMKMQIRVTGMTDTKDSAASANSTSAIDRITALTPTGFTVDASGAAVPAGVDCNANGVVYEYLAISQVPGEIKVGTYTGDGTDNRNITGIGFQPDFVQTMRSGSSAVWRTNTIAGDLTSWWDGSAPFANGIQSLLADGFQVGSDMTVNLNANTYWYIACKKVAGKFNTGTYTGTGTTRSITGVGFRPEGLFIKREGTTSPGIKWASSGVNVASFMSMLSAIQAPDIINSLDADGFSLGTTGNRVNGATAPNTYHWFAWAPVAAAAPTTTVTSLNRVNPATTNLSTVNWTLTFAAANTGVSASNFSLSGAAATGASVGTPSIASGGGLTWNVPVTTGSTDGTLTLSLANATGTTPGVSTTLPFTTAGQDYTMDKTGPTATIVVADTSLLVGETSLVTITFSEAVTGFTNVDLTIANGTLSGVSSGDGGITWTATLTPTSNLTDSTNVITLSNAGVIDFSGNVGTGTTNSNNYAMDTQRPTATVVVSDSGLIAGETALVTITFSEAVNGFTNADLTIANGTLSAVSSGDGGVTWTATLTPASNVTDSTNVITLNNTGFTDVPGNAGSGTTNSNNYAIDNVRPTATVVVADTSLIIGETALVTITFSEAVVGFTNADLTIANGTLSAVSTGDGGVTWTATLTPTSNLTDSTNVITLSNAGVTDASGNAGTGTTNSNNYAIDTERPTVTTSAPSVSTIAAGAGSVTYTVTYADTNFASSSLTTPGITLNPTGTANGTVGLSGSGTSYTVTISSITGVGSLGITVGANTSLDTAGNANLVSLASTTFAVTAPVVALSTNDLMVIAYNSSDEVPQNSIALLATADIPNGTTIFLTDRGWQTSTNSLRTFGTTEKSITWVTSGVTAGKIIRISMGVPNNLDLNINDVVASFIGTTYGTLDGAINPDQGTGDQILIYTTADNQRDSTPTFIHALNADGPVHFNPLNDDGPSDGWSDPDTTNFGNTSKLPPGLTAVLTAGDGGSAFGLATYNFNSVGPDEYNNYIYNGPTSQTTRALWIARITTPSNWIGRDAVNYDTQTAGALSPANSNYQIGAPAPEIAVTETVAGDIPDNTGTFSFGTTPVGTSVTKTFTVTNSGSATLNLSALSVPSGFTITQNFASSIVAASGGTTTFQITMDAGAAATPSGTLTFTNDDADENPYNFTISGTVLPIPVVTINPTSQTLAHNDLTQQVFFTSTVAGTTYAWSNDNTSIGIGASGTGASIAPFTATNSGSSPQTGTFTVTPTANGVQGTAQTFTVTVNPPNPTVTLVSNLGNTSGGISFVWYTPGDGIMAPPFGVSLANSFTTGASAALLDSITLSLGNASTGGGFTVRLYSSNGASGPGTLIATLTGSANPFTAGTYTYIPGSPLTLAAATTYFVVASVPMSPPGSNYAWNYTANAAETGTAGWSIGDKFWSSTNGGAWAMTSPTNSLQFSVNGTLSGPPAPTVTVSTANLLTTATTLTITGTGFDTTAANNTVAFTPSGTGTVTAATPTSLTVSSLAGLTAGALNAVATTNGQSSGAPVQVATVITPAEIAVSYNGNDVADNSISVATLNGTDFGDVPVQGVTVDHVFTITNSGDTALTLGSVSAGGDFTVTQPTSPVAANGGTSTFTVSFNPSATGTRTATITFSNDDGDETPFNFDVSGVGTGPQTFDLAGNAVSNTPFDGGETYIYSAGPPPPPPAAPVVATGGESVVTGGNAPDPTGADSGLDFSLVTRSGFIAENGNLAFASELTGAGVDATNFKGFFKHDGTSLKRLARTGDDAPETGATAAKFSDLPLIPGINDDGQVTLFAQLAANPASTPATTVDNDTGLWSELGGTGFQILMREGDDIPGLLPVTQVGRFGSGCFATADTGAGTAQAAFTITMKGASTDTALLRASILGSTVTAVGVVAQENAAAPGVSGESFSILNGSYTDAVRMDAQGNIAFGAVLKPSGKTSLWYQPVAGGAPVKAMVAGDAAPGTTGATFLALDLPIMGDKGTFSFRGVLNTDGDNATNDKNDGIWRGTAAGGFSNILRRGDSNTNRPGLFANGTIKAGNIFSGWLNNNNRGAWLGWVDSAGDGISSYPADTFGIYTDMSGSMNLLISSGDTAPGMPVGATMFYVDHPVVSGGGQNNYLAFLATVTGGGTAASNNKGIWRSLNGTAPTLVLRTGDSMTVTPGGSKVIANIDIPGSNDAAHVWETPVMDGTGRLLVNVSFTDGTTTQVIIP